MKGIQVAIVASVMEKSMRLRRSALVRQTINWRGERAKRTSSHLQAQKGGGAGTRLVTWVTDGNLHVVGLGQEQRELEARHVRRGASRFACRCR